MSTCSRRDLDAGQRGAAEPQRRIRRLHAVELQPSSLARGQMASGEVGRRRRTGRARWSGTRQSVRSARRGPDRVRRRRVPSALPPVTMFSSSRPLLIRSSAADCRAASAGVRRPGRSASRNLSRSVNGARAAARIQPSSQSCRSAAEYRRTPADRRRRRYRADSRIRRGDGRWLGAKIRPVAAGRQEPEQVELFVGRDMMWLRLLRFRRWRARPGSRTLMAVGIRPSVWKRSATCCWLAAKLVVHRQDLERGAIDRALHGIHGDPRAAEADLRAPARCDLRPGRRPWRAATMLSR